MWRKFIGMSTLSEFLYCVWLCIRDIDFANLVFLEKVGTFRL